MTLGGVEAHGWARFIVVASLGLLTFGVGNASAAQITPTDDAQEVANAVAADPALVTGASFVTRPNSFVKSTAVSDVPLAKFATDGPDYGILSTGNPLFADLPNNDPDLGYDLGGDKFQGTNNFDVTVMKVDVDVPANAGDCLSMNYRFLSEEFDEFVGSPYNDSFILQLDRYDWDAKGGKITAPGDFATSGIPVGINSTGDYAVSPSLSTGTTYDAATNLINAKTRITPGTHSVYITIFDQGDEYYDSAAFIDNMRVTTQPPGNCEPPPVTAPTVVTPKTKVGPDSNINRFASQIKAKNLTSFSGTASADEKVAAVQIALVNLKYGAQASAKKRKRAPRCVHMNTRRLMTQRRSLTKKCSPMFWITVEGTDSWKFDLKRKLSKGNYMLYSRAIDRDGIAENRFDAADSNRVSFTVR